MASATSPLAARGTCRSPDAVRIVTSLSRGVEADARDGHVVDHDGVELLALELAAAVLERARARLGGEADQHLLGAARGGQAR